MTVKEVLNLFFMHPIKGVPVADSNDENLLGILTKEKLIEIASNRSELDLDISKEAKFFLVSVETKNIENYFEKIDEHYAIPVINTKGEIIKSITKEELLNKKESVITKTETVYKEERNYEILNEIPAAILVFNTNQIILFANRFFLQNFSMEKEFVIGQHITSFFPKLRLKGLSGVFSYAHKQWNYNLQYGLKESIICFQEVYVKTVSQDDNVVDKILSGKTNLKSQLEQIESKIIKKVYQRLKGNIKSSAQLLGLTEENLRFKLQKIK